ncbi:MAG: flagellar biosynthesis protein FliR [Rhodobacterales bacterium 32-67-9]|nr:MAG: flagellar biosynthesis protein FliR [Rhodobacterales bacterium 32-67-9]
MIALAQTLLDMAGQGAITGFLTFLRIGAVMAVLPGFGEHTVPVRVKLGLAIAFTAIVAPSVAPVLGPLTSGAASVLISLATETLIGLSLGLVLRLAVLALEMAGTMAAQSTSLSQLFGAGGEPMPTMSHLFVAGGLALAMMAGLHVQVAEVLILSYDVLPPGAFPDAGTVRGWGIAHIARAFALAFSLAAPFVIASVIYNIALGAINRAMPQLMVAFVGAPALTLGALMLLAVALLGNPFGAPA